MAGIKQFFESIGHYLLGIGKAIGAQLKIDTETFLKTFVKDDLGALAVDAVKYVQGLELKDTAARDAAKTQFVADAEKAGKDLAAFGQSQLNWFIETALQAIEAKLA